MSIHSRLTALEDTSGVNKEIRYRVYACIGSIEGKKPAKDGHYLW